MLTTTPPRELLAMRPGDLVWVRYRNGESVTDVPAEFVKRHPRRVVVRVRRDDGSAMTMVVAVTQVRRRDPGMV